MVGFMVHMFRADQHDPDVLAAVYQWESCADVLVLVDDQRAHAYRVPTWDGTDVFAPTAICWWYHGKAVWALRALPTLPESNHLDSPGTLLPAPPGAGIPGARIPVSDVPSACFGPTQAGISIIHIVVNPQTAIMVRLREAEPALLAAGLVEWQCLLGRTEIWAWRTPRHIVVTGYGSECAETPIAVLAGPMPYDDQFDLDPDASDRLGTETFYDWFGAEVVRTWPFTTPGAHQ
jgi:hypothetical protein